MRRAPAPPSVRTASAASVASWNSPHGPHPRDRMCSSSTRTSSLTSVVNMYYRMPPALKAAQLGPSPPPPPPLYYDYTEDFENKELQLPTPLEPVAPIPTRAPSVQRPLVLREGSDEELAAALGVEPESAFIDTDSQQDDYRDETELDILGDAESTAEPSTQVHNTVRTQHTDPEGLDASVVPILALGGRKLTRGSDIDLLPSQVGRGSVDTFRPSLDIESRDIPLFSYPSFRQRTSTKASTPSPARQVQVHDGRTPTIRSEQGVILRNDAPDATSGRAHDEDEHQTEINTPEGPFTVQILNTGRTKSDSSHGILNLRASTQDGATTTIRRPATTDPFRAEISQAELGWKAQKPTSKANTIQEYVNPEKCLKSTPPSASLKIIGVGQMTSSRGNESSINARNHPTHFTNPQEQTSERQFQLRGHRRNHAALRIASRGLTEDDETLQLCSNTPLISPKPISPARELKVKNSIPKLMKELPPLPDEPGYATSSSSTTVDKEVAEVLKPYRFSRPATPRKSGPPRGPMEPRTTINAASPFPGTQKKLPKIRIKPKGHDVGPGTNPRDSRPWNSEINYPWCNETPDAELTHMNVSQGDTLPMKQRLRLRGSRSVGVVVPSGTVRQNPKACKSDVFTNLANQQAKDLFSISTGLTSIFRQVSSKLSHDTHDAGRCRTASASDDAQKSTLSGESFKLPRIVLTRASGRRQHGTNSSDKESVVQQHRGVRKRLSNLGWLLARPSHAQLRERHANKAEILHGKQRAGLESTFGLGGIDFESKNFTTSEGITLEPQLRPRFRRRMKAKISKWVRGTKAAVKSCRKGSHGIEAI